jgi:hypothetical protein
MVTLDVLPAAEPPPEPCELAQPAAASASAAAMDAAPRDPIRLRSVVTMLGSLGFGE